MSRPYQITIEVDGKDYPATYRQVWAPVERIIYHTVNFNGSHVEAPTKQEAISKAVAIIRKSAWEIPTEGHIGD